MEAKELEALLESCLREYGEKNPNGLGLYFEELRKEVERRTPDRRKLSPEKFSDVFSSLVNQGKLIFFGAIKRGLFTIRLREP